MKTSGIPGRQPQSRVHEARARQIEIANEKATGKLIELEDSYAGLDEVCGIVISALSSLPARATRDAGVRRKLEDLVCEVRNEMADAMNARAYEPTFTGGIDTRRRRTKA